MKKILVLVLAAGLIWELFISPGQVTIGPGVLVDESPEQTAVKSPEQFQVDGYDITTLANFQLKAKVLGRKNYRMGREADLSPVDLALGWGRMSDEAILEKITVSQSGRWYHWRVDEFPIPRREIETHSANMHLIPADKSVKAAIEAVRDGDLIELSGSLVQVETADGWKWRSSLTRQDTGNHSCELIWVEAFRIITP